jgi:hypothetical protein
MKLQSAILLLMFASSSLAHDPSAWAYTGIPNNVCCNPTLQSCSLGQSEVADFGVVSESQVEHNSNLSGRVSTTGKANLDLKRLFRAVRTDKNGQFSIKNVAPGSYHVIAFMGNVPSQPSYDDSLTAASAGFRVVLAEKQSKNLELELFEAHR